MQETDDTGTMGGDHLMLSSTQRLELYGSHVSRDVGSEIPMSDD